MSTPPAPRPARVFRRLPPPWERAVARLARAQTLWVIIAVVAAVLQLRGWWHPGGDASNYLNIARYLSQGELSTGASSVLKHLPGYSLLITPAFWTGHRPWFVISVIHLGIALVLIWALVKWLRPIVGSSAGLVMAFVIANAGLWEIWRMTQSEVAFVPMLVVSALAIRQMFQACSWKAWLGWALLAGLCVAYAGMIRHAGTLIVGGLAISGVMLAFRGEVRWWRAAGGGLIVAVIAAGVLGGWMMREHAASQREHGEFKAVTSALSARGDSKVNQMIESARMRIGEAGRLSIPGMIKVYARKGEWLHYNTIIFITINIGLLIGWWQVARKRADALLWSLPFLLALNVFYAGDAGTRYTVPLLPMIAVSVWGFLRCFASLGRLVLVVLVIAHFAVALVYWAASLEDVSLAAYWDDVDRTALVIPQGADGVYAVSMDKKYANMLQVELQTKIRGLDAKAIPPQRANWLIMWPDRTPTVNANKIDTDTAWDVYQLKEVHP